MGRNKNLIRQTTEYAEALALMFYCYKNNLDFNFLISKRNLDNLNKFPDFEINNDLYLEVARCLDDIGGKQNKDTALVFDSSNKQETINELRFKNALYESKGNPHNIDFYLLENCVATSIPLLYGIDILSTSLIKVVEKNILIAGKRLSNKKIVDLFIVSYYSLSNEELNCFSNMLFHVHFDPHIRCVLLNYIVDDHFAIFEYCVKKKTFEIHDINKHIDCDEIENKIIELKWLKGKLYETVI